MINIALAKGVVKEKSINLIEELLDIKITNKGLLSFSKGDVNIFLLKHRDIPKLVESGKIDIGITSMEWIEETQSKVEIIDEIDWCDTRISLISPIGKSSYKLSKKEKIYCVTEFPNISSDYFRNEKNVSIEFVSGSSEALVPLLNDCCIDCVETGSTLKAQNLYEEKVIFNSRMVLIGNINNKTKDIVKDLREILHS